MPNLSGLSPLTIQLTDATLNLATTFKPNKPYPGIVHLTPKGAHIQVAGTQIPLPAGSPLSVGQTVTVTHQAGSEGAKFVVLPSPQTPVASPPVPAQSLPVALLKTLMEEMPLLKGLSPQQATNLSPSQLPSTEFIVRMALQVFEFNTPLQDTLRQLTQIQEQLRANQMKSPLLTKILELFGANLKTEDPESLLTFLKTLQSHIKTVALPHSNPTTPEESLYVLLGKLRNDPALNTFLESKGTLTSLHNAVETLQDHFAGQHLQNARSTEFPYLYLNIPLPEESGLQRAQIHVLGEGHGENTWDESGNSQIVLDIQTTQLGELWIEVNHRPEHCLCQFEVENEGIAQQINEASDTLKGRLEAQGFHGVQVQASPKSAGRMESLARLLHRYSGLDLQA